MVRIFPDKPSMSIAAARHAVTRLHDLLQAKASVRLIAATGASQLSFLEELTREHSLDWSRVELFHLDEYIGIGPEHPASFARYIRERIVEPLNLRRYHLLDGKRHPKETITEANALIRAAPVDLAFVGIGENGHLAFNDPPADLDTEDPYIVVNLDLECRQQQVNEGWFATVDEVPERAISMSIRQILNSNEIVCVVPGAQKAAAVRAALEGPVCVEVPASLLQTHPRVSIFLDAASASQLGTAMTST
ncbi:MAG: 6-phosphogluconolactonase [Bryobacteraceae bacterium]